MRKIVGTPSFVSGKTLIYSHEHQETIHDLAYTADNMSAIVLSAGIASAIETSKTTVNLPSKNAYSGSFDSSTSCARAALHAASRS